MINGTETLPNNLQDLRVGLDCIRTREVLVTNQDRFHGSRVEHLPYAFVSRDSNGLVGRVGEPFGVDDGRVSGISG